MKKHFLLYFAFILSCCVSFGQWQKTNDSTSSVYCFLVKNNNYFAGSYGSVLLSADNGTNWAVQNNGLPWLPVLSIATDGSNLFASTGDYITGVGVFMSSDNGVSWSAINYGLPDYHSCNAIAIIGNRMLVAVQDSGIYYSDNSGASWTLSDLKNKCVFAFAEKDSIVFAGTYHYGMYLSTNKGQNWISINNGLPTNTTIFSIAVNGANIFAGTSIYGVYLSTNNGQNWINSSNGLPTSDNIRSIVISDNRVFAVASYAGVFVSNSNGSNWSSINEGLPGGTEFYSLYADDTNLFAGTGLRGIWKRPLAELTGIINNNENDEIEIRPNPAHEWLNINVKEKNTTVEFYDMSGKIQRKEILNGQQNIDIRDLERGMYLIRITNGKAIYSKKIMIE